MIELPRSFVLGMYAANLPTDQQAVQILEILKTRVFERVVGKYGFSSSVAIENGDPIRRRATTKRKTLKVLRDLSKLEAGSELLTFSAGDTPNLAVPVREQLSTHRVSIAFANVDAVPARRLTPTRIEVQLLETAIPESDRLDVAASLVECGIQLAITLEADYTGYVTLDRCNIGMPSPFELVRDTRYLKQDIPQLLRGVYWGNFFNDEQVKKIGGVEAVRKLFPAETRALPGGVYAQLTQTIDEVTVEQVRAVATVVEHLLPEYNTSVLSDHRRKLLPPLLV